MHSTFTNLKELAKLHTGSTDFSDLAFEYQVMEGEEPVIFSVVFCKVYPFIVEQMEKYYTLTHSDKISLSVEELHKALMDFEPDRGAKFLTLFGKYLRNRYRTELQLSTYEKRRANVDAVQESEYEDVRSVYPDEYAAVELRQMLTHYNLTPNEMKYCEIVMEDTIHVKDVDIAQKLGITSAGVSWIKNSLQKKLGGMFFAHA